jgi:hypothetical protein
LDETGLEAVLPVDKSGRVYVVGSVPLLHAEAQTVEEMLEGWRNQQLCRNLDHETIAGRIRIVQRFVEVTNEFPWTWTAVMAEEFFSDLRAIHRRKQSTIRGYQNALKLFCSYVSHPDYGWDRVCEQRFGTHPAQVFFEWNTAAHVQDNEQTPDALSPSRSCRTFSTTPTTRSRWSRRRGARAGCRPTAIGDVQDRLLVWAAVQRITALTDRRLLP